MHTFKINYYIKVAVIIIVALLFWAIIFWAPIMTPYIPLLLSLVLFSFIGFRLYKYYTISNWETVFGSIQYFEEKYVLTKESVYLSVKEFYPEVKYRYEYKNTVCESQNVFYDFKDVVVCEVDMQGNPVCEKEKPWYGWKEGSKIKVYVNPHKPCDSLLFINMSKGNIYRTIVYAICALILFMLWLFLEDVHQLLL